MNINASLAAASLLAITAGSVTAQAVAYDAEALSYRAAKAYDAGDDTRAAFFWRLAGKAGSADSMTAYAGMRAAGIGVAADLADARRWYARAARRGDAHAMALLADAIADDDPLQAQALYARASALGHVYATHRLAHPPGETKVTTKGGYGENQ